MYKNSKFRSRFLSSNSFCIKTNSAEFVTKNSLYNVHTYLPNSESFSTPSNFYNIFILVIYIR